jgi:DNA anti-recombination protein RmuC
VAKLSDEEDVSEQEDESPEEEMIPEEDKPPEDDDVSGHEDVMSEFMGLNEKQLQTYSLILTLGQVTTGDIAIVMNSDSEEVENIISELENRKLLTTLPGLVPRYQAVPPFDELVKEVSTIGEKIERLREELKEQLRTASMAVRDSIFDLAKENLEKMESLTSQQNAHKSDTMTTISRVMDDWSETSQKVVEDSTEMIETTIEAAKSETSQKIAPVLSSAKEDIVSQSKALVAEIEAWASNAKNISEDLKSGLTGHINTFQEKTLQIVNNQSRAISDSISMQLETTTSSLQKSKIVQLEQLGILKESTADELTSLSNQISHAVADTQNSIGKSLEDVSNNLVEELEGVRQTFTETFQEYTTTDDTAISEFDTGTEVMFDEYTRKQNDALEELASTIEGITSNLSTQSQSACSSISQQVDGLATRTQDQMTSAMGRMRELSVNTIQDVFRVTDNSSKSLLGETEAQLSSGKEKLQTAMDETSQSMKTLNQHSLEMYSGVLDKTRSTVGQQLGGIAERTKVSIDEFANTAVDELEMLKTSLQEQITQAIAKGTEQIRAVTTTASNEIEQGIENELQRLGSNLDEQMTEYGTKHDTMTRNIDETITEQARQHSEIIDNLLTRATVLHEEMLDEVDSIRRHSIGELDTNLNDSTSITVDSILQMKAETSEIIHNMENLLQQSIATTGNKTNNAVNGAKSATTTYLDSYRENRTNLIADLRSKRGELSSSFLESVESAVGDSQARLRDETAASLQTLAEKSDQIRTSMQTEIAGFGEKGAAALTNASEEMTQAYDSADSSVRTTLEKANGDLSNSLDGLKGELEEHSISLLSQLDSSMSELKSKVDSEIEQRKAGLDSTSENTKSRIDSVSDQLRGTMETAADSLKRESIKVVTASVDSATKSIEGLKPELEQSMSDGYTNLDNDTNAVKNALNRLLSKLEESPMLGLTEDTLDEAFAAPAEGMGSDAAAVLSKVWERVGETDFPGAKDFWTVSTRPAVLAHISDMVLRAKSKITLILAYPAEIPTEMLVGLKTTTGVELVVTEGGLLADKVRPLVGRGNIRVRTRTDMDVYACVRDSEEVLLAPVTKDDRDVIGIATEDPGFVKFVMGVVGPIFQAKTKLLRQGDI